MAAKTCPKFQKIIEQLAEQHGLDMDHHNCVVSEINVTSHRGRKWEVQVKALLALKYLNSLGWSISY